MASLRRGFERQAQFERNLAQQPAGMREAILTTQRRVTDEHAKRLARTVPLGSPYRGHLVSSIRVRQGRHEFVRIVSIGSATSPYAGPLELGHRNPDGSRTRPIKFYFPLVAIMRRKYRAALRRAVRRILRGK